MTGSLSARMIRIVIVAMLFASAAIAPALAAPVSQPASLSSGQQEEPSELPGFGELPEDATLVSSTSGELDEAVEAPVTLVVERLSVDAGDTVEPVDGPQIIQVEQGLLTYEDDLGLEAEISAGGAQFFAAGAVGAITNSGDDAAVIVRTTLGEAAAPDDDESDDQGAEGDSSETRDRDARNITQRGGTPGVHALFAQSSSDAAPDEVVLTLTDEGFDPDEFEIVQGGDLVIENATETACLFEIPDLQIETEIGDGDIESVTVDGPAGTHEFTCTTDDDEVLGEGSFFLARPETATETPEPDETEEPAASPEPDDEAATPIASPEADETAEATPTTTEPVSGEAPVGVLIEATLETVPEDAQELFAAQIVLDPGSSLSLGGIDGSIGVNVTGGDLTVTRPASSPARLRDGRSVLLPDGTIATLINNGDDPITLQIAGLIGAAPVDDEPADEPTEEPADDNGDGDGDGGDQAADDGPIDVSGANQFVPSDAEMEQLGLFGQRGGAVENEDPAENALWFSDRDQAAELLPTFDWQGNVTAVYDSNSDETDYGEVDLFVINVDIFAGEEQAADFFGYVEDEIFMGQSDSSSTVESLEGIDQQQYVTFFDSDSETEFGLMMIRSGEYTVTLYASGPDVDAAALMEDVASLIFGPRG